jgi:hypothetical protein
MEMDHGVLYAGLGLVIQQALLVARGFAHPGTSSNRSTRWASAWYEICRLIFHAIIAPRCAG